MAHPAHTVFLAVLLFTFGCNRGPTVVPVKGSATRGGLPVSHVALTFFPDEGRASTAITDEQGRFELIFDREKKGASLGKHKIVAAFRVGSPRQEKDLADGTIKLHPEQDAINEKYGQRETTPLTVEVTKAEEDLQLRLD